MEKPVHFNGLNGIRAIASLLVVIWHTDQFSRLFNIKEIGFHKNGMAGNAVDMFFVLSGFLITYLLLIEKAKTNTINLKNFYLRRIFRIWPLYYFALIMSLVLIYLKIIPNVQNISTSLFFYIFLMANIAYVLKITIPGITPLWSIGVEEQYYLLWPHIVKRSSNYLKSFFYFFVVYSFIKLLSYLIFTPDSTIYEFLITTRIDIMCMGAIGAYIAYSKKNILLKIIYRKEIQILSWFILIISIIYKPIHIYSFIDPEINSIFYLFIILNISSNKKSLISLENIFFNFIGKISYGIYVYHMILIYLISYLFSYLNLQLRYIEIHIIVLISTIFVAWISYKFFETPFLKLKNKYSIIKSSTVIKEVVKQTK